MTAASAARCSTCWIAPSRRWARACCGRGSASRLLDRKRLEDRLNAVEALVSSGTARAAVRDGLRPVSDIERLTNRLLIGRAGPRDLLALANGLEAVPGLREVILPRRPPGIDLEAARSVPGRGEPDPQRDHRRSAGRHEPDRRDPARLFAGTGRGRLRESQREGLGRRSRRDGARAHRDQESESRLQQGVWLLHRGQPRQHRARAGRTTSASRRSSTPNAISRRT